MALGVEKDKLLKKSLKMKFNFDFLHNYILA